MMVAIHQPTFLPWLGWWDKLNRADVLVLLDDVQFPKKGGTWTNRVRMLVNRIPTWVTVPVDRQHRGVRSIRDTLINDEREWRVKTMKTIAASYGRALHFDEVSATIEEVLTDPANRLAEFNESGVRRLVVRLGLDGQKLVRQSDLGVSGLGTDLLIAICEKVGATSYLTGDGADGYLKPEKFADAGLRLLQQQFSAPRYPQLVPEYVPGLSVVDALMNCGWKGTSALLRERR